MQVYRKRLCGFLVAAFVLAAWSQADATTLIRAGLDSLVKANRTIVVGEVRDVHSYWNQEGTFILTDVRIQATDVLKGNPRDTDLTITILGGTVGDLTTLIVAGAELIPGKSYVLFLQEDNLPGVRGVRTVRQHAQGVFEVVKARDGVRAISQASRHPLYPDALGFVDPPGGAKGLLLSDMVRSIRQIAGRQAALQEVR
jgi:hypothetical protein